MQTAAVEHLQGTVESVTFSNPDSGFTVMELATEQALITVVGTLPGIAPGEEVVLTGRFSSHPTYGHQFRAELCERTLPAGATAIFKYLASGTIKGIGPRIARRIVDAFGDDALEVIEKRPEQLARIQGISARRAEEITEEYRHIFGIRAVMTALSRYQVEPAAAVRVWRQWGNLSVDVLRENPYQLCCEAVGVSFEKAEEIAEHMDFDTASPHRLKAGLVHVLTANLNNGHTCLPQARLLPVVASLLDVDTDVLEEMLETAVQEGDLCADSPEGERYIYLPEMYEAETYIAGRLGMLLCGIPPHARSYPAAIERLETRLGIHYADAQRRAIESAMNHPVFILTGGPGTGKTTTLKGILELLEEEELNVALAAPTGRAAQRIAEVTGREASTIHRLLEVDYREEGSTQIKFKRNEKNPLRHQVIIVDEASMMDTRLFCSLLRALKLSARLILVGDSNQLPSVGAGNVLRDILADESVERVHLSEIFRQAQQSAIVTNAHRIVRGELPDLAVRDSDFFFMQSHSYESTMHTVLNLVETRLPKAYGFSPLEGIQVIAPSRVGALGTAELNRRLQERLNPSDPSKVEHQFGTIVLREQDKVMQIKNNYDILWRKDFAEQGTGVFNGDIGVVEMIDRPSQTVLVRYNDKVAEYTFDMVGELEHAYAVTVHKSQGSEFDAVVVPLMNYHPKLYYRNILYTGVTRARKLLILLGSPETVAAMVHNDRKVLRYTNLTAFLADAISRESAQ